MTDIIPLSYVDIGFAALFLLLPALLSMKQDMGFHADLIVGGLRCFAQLMAAGYLLKYIFAINTWYLMSGVLVMMLFIASYISTKRTPQPIPGLFRLTAFSIGVTSFLTLFFITLVIIRVEPWYEPRYLIPLAGMVIGNAMNGAALAAERLASEMRLRKQTIEVYLSLGATPGQASREAIRSTVKAALIPTINSLMSVGIVHLPGIMTGQILSGTSPTIAIRYQIVIMYMVVFVVTVTAILVTALAHRRYFTRRMQLQGAFLAGGKL